MNPRGRLQPVAQLLPEDARLMLQRAAQTRIPDDDPLARQKALEDATARVKRMYPEFFMTTQEV